MLKIKKATEVSLWPFGNYGFDAKSLRQVQLAQTIRGEPGSMHGDDTNWQGLERCFHMVRIFLLNRQACQVELLNFFIYSIRGQA